MAPTDGALGRNSGAVERATTAIGFDVSKFRPSVGDGATYWPCLPAARPCPTPGQQFCLLENSKILILTASVKLKDKHLFSKKGTYCHGQGFKIGLNENFPYFSEIQENIFFSDKHTYFVTYTHTI